MTVTSADVARLAGLSRATVSQVLNGHANRFAAETARKVHAAAQELGYEPSAAGRMLRRGSSDLIVALVPNTTFGGNLQNIFGAVTELLAQHGLTLVLRLATQSPSSLDRLLAGMRPRAVLSLQPFSPEEHRVLSERGIPGFDTSTGGDLNYEIGRIQAEHLVQRGFRSIAFAHLRDEREDPYGGGREKAVADVCTLAKLSAPASIGTGIDLQQAHAALDEVDRGFGIACYNDDVAITLLTATRERGWRVPEDIGLVGMDNTPLAAVTYPRLTTIGYDYTAAARMTVAAALGALGESDASAPRLDIDLQLVAGGST